jgi:hypothetical protein
MRMPWLALVHAMHGQQAHLRRRLNARPHFLIAPSSRGDVHRGLGVHITPHPAVWPHRRQYRIVVGGPVAFIVVNVAVHLQGGVPGQDRPGTTLGKSAAEEQLPSAFVPQPHAFGSSTNKV